MKKFKTINNITGWIIFLIASAVYILTIEPTASFWDCGEFIATAFKLEVGHPPGAYLFMMLARFATFFSFGHTEWIPITVNVMSALMSGFTILFLYWTITHLARKIVGIKEEYSLAENIAIIGSGILGALAYTFSDSFWFSAVEAEVYASSSFFTAIVFWAVLKWENVADEKYSNRWLILIAYLMGLSIGVHLLNLLAIPAIAIVYYFRKYTYSHKGLIATFAISVVILGIIQYGIIQGIFAIAGKIELLFVNGFGLPYNTGWVFYTIVLVGLVLWGIWYTSKKGKALLNTILVCFAVILLGYSSVVAVIIRSNVNTPLNENDPSNLFSLLSYLNREQYGDRPLLFGQYYNAPAIDQKDGKAIYAQKDGKYKEIYHRPEYVYDSQFTTIFPRMYSPESSHVQAYKEWGKVKGTPIAINNQGQSQTVYKPTFGENLRFFFNYQVGFMYLRYFMWNFAGRQNDIQGHGSPIKGNWISGIKFVDEARLGPQDNLPASMKSNKGRNAYFMLPLLLGLIGLYFHMQKHQKDFGVVALLFFMTGLAIVIYLNQTPYQPRERDYAYVGSFYAFAIWIGLGVMALINWLSKKMPATPAGILVTLVTLVAVPGLMAQQNWDDHDRSGRYTCRDFAYNYLNSCEKDAIIFTNGDNDTFPLWYIQEVEGVRTDVRVVNLSYLGADWYINQMQRKVYESDPLPFNMKNDKYETGKRDALYVVNLSKNYENIKDVMDFVASDNPEKMALLQQQFNVREHIDFIPASKFYLNVDSATVVNNGTVTPKFAHSIAKQMRWDLGKRNAIYKNDMMVLDLMAHNNWKRPVYFAITVSDDSYLGLEKYFRLDGLAYRIVPVETIRQDGQSGSIDTKILYDNMMNKFVWGNISDPKVYLDENNQRMVSNFRNNFARLAEELIVENKKDSALKVLDKCMAVMPINQVPMNVWSVPIIEAYYRLGKKEKAIELSKMLAKDSEDDLRFYFRFKGSAASGLDREKQMSLYALNQLGRLADAYGEKTMSTNIEKVLQEFLPQMQQMQ
jgi:hypothetical protein